MPVFSLFFQNLLRVVVQVRQRWSVGCTAIADFWNQSSGDWQWLSEKPMPVVGINRQLWKASVPSLSFFFLLGMSAVIATLGLLAGSAATIIGAMIVAPLMGPIIGIAYAMVVANRRLLRRSSLTLLTGVIMTVGVSVLIAQVVGLRTLNPEVMARVRPTLIDLGVALAAGAAGAFAKSRRSIADALPGVAIAVALVPPLSVVGIGLSLGDRAVSLGALILFTTNLIGIIFSGGLVFLCQRYGSLDRAKNGLMAGVVALAVLALPLGLSLRNILIKENVRTQIGVLIRRQTVTFSDRDVRYLSVQPVDETLRVELEVAAPQGAISARQVELVRAFLADQLGQSVSLKVQVIPVETIETQAAPPPGREGLGGGAGL